MQNIIEKLRLIYVTLIEKQVQKCSSSYSVSRQIALASWVGLDERVGSNHTGISQSEGSFGGSPTPFVELH